MRSGHVWEADTWQRAGYRDVPHSVEIGLVLTLHV